MSRIVLGRDYARFDLSRDPWFMRPLFWPAIASRRMRQFFYELPPSRMRMAFVGLFFWRLVEEITRGNARRMVGAVDPDAELEMYLETFRGREGWVKAFEHWLESLEGFSLRVEEIINPPGRYVIAAQHASGEGARSGLKQEDDFFLVFEIEKGMAVRGKVYRDRDQALAAIGLDGKQKH
jgi:hypothetical protein